LKIELERSLSRLANELVDEKGTEGQWIAAFVQACDWFKKQVVSIVSRSC
jgi:hypothetical protein